MCRLEETFPAHEITKPEVFPSLLFYYSMLTIKATMGNQLVLGIPNNNVRKQYYGFLLEEYQKVRHINLNDLELKFTYMALMGKWQDAVAQIDRYAAALRVEALRQGTQLHRIIMQFDGYKLRRMEEVE